MEKVIIGKIVNTHGIKGELKVYPNTDFIDERFKKGNTLYIEYNNQEIKVTTKSYRVHKGMVLVLFEGYEDINLVEKFKQTNLIAEIDHDLLNEGEYYYADIIGCKVIDDKYGEIGFIESVMETKAHSILVIKTKKGIIKIPYVDAFIKEESIEDKFFKVQLIDGMYNED